MQAPSPWIYALYMDEEGSIWIGTSAGVNRFNPDMESFETFQSGIGVKSRASESPAESHCE
jgi:ligand-binding sensor domain-containing protein